MKEALSMILVLTMVLALALPAMAEEITPAKGDASQNVNATYTGETVTAGTTYYVTITWDADNSNTLAYTGKQGTYTWSGENMKYTDTTPESAKAKWAGAATYKVTVSNQSNAEVIASVAASETKYGITVSNTGDTTATLGRADKDLKDKIPEAAARDDMTGTATTLVTTYTYDATKATGDPTAAEVKDGTDGNKYVQIGTITVTISHN